MKVILREDVYNLGRSGEVVTVKDGYARNFLLPRAMASLANEGNVRRLEHEKRVIEAKAQKLKAGAVEIAGKLNILTVTTARKVGDQDKLFGSVTALDVVHLMAQAGQKIDRKAVRLPEPIRTLGTHAIEVKLHHDVTATVRVIVVAETVAAS